MADFGGQEVESIVHKVAYIFDPSDDEEYEAANGVADGAAPPGSAGKNRKHGRTEDRALKSRKRKSAKSRPVGDGEGDAKDAEDAEDAEDDYDHGNSLSAFPTLLQGREAPEAVARRRELFSSIWAKLDDRIQTVLQRSNQATLSAVMGFVEKPIESKLPAAFVILGPAATTDMLLFRQLSASLADSEVRINKEATKADDGHRERCVRRLVRLRAAEVPNLRAALKTIVQAATSPSGPSATDNRHGNAGLDEEDIVAHNGSKYLAYDLEAVATVINSASSATTASRIVVAFEDSEAFDAALLADLLSFLHSWLDRIPIVLLFGVATSVDLFQARLPKQAAHRLTAAQFDVAPSSAVLDRLVRRAVAAADVPLRIGPLLLRSLAERQDEQVTGVSVFVNSLKDIGSNDTAMEDNASFLQNPDYLAAIRQLPSFRRHVEDLVAKGHIDAAKQLLSDGADADQQHLRQAVAEQLQYQRDWNKRLARALQIASASGVFANQSFTELYITALEDQRGGDGDDGGFTLDDDDGTSLAATMTTAIRRMSSAELVAMVRRLAATVQAGDADLALEAQPAGAHQDLPEDGGEDLHSMHWASLPTTLLSIADQVEELQKQLEASHARRARQRVMFIKVASNDGSSSPGGGRGGGGGGAPQLRSKYTAHNKVLRTTVVAQKVQLSRDSMALTEEDQAFTELVDKTVAALTSVVDVEPVTSRAAAASLPRDAAASAAHTLWLQEIWLYDARTPYRDVFIPRPGMVVERALARPHDYLACECCAAGKVAGAASNKTKKRKGDHDGGAESIKPTMPATSILYHLYLDAGPLINVADLWEAFKTAVSNSGNGQTGDREGGGDSGGDDNNREDEDNSEGADEEDTQERRHLVQFYQGLSEMKTLGYIKPTRRKVDHVAKIKWL